MGNLYQSERAEIYARLVEEMERSEHAEAELAKAQAAIERVKALADEWEGKQERNRARYLPGPLALPTSPNIGLAETFEPVSELRAALAEPEAGSLKGCAHAERAWDEGYSCGLGDYGKDRARETCAANPYRQEAD